MLLSRSTPFQPSEPVVLVTGASSGIGLATICQLADQGFTVYAASRSILTVWPDLSLTDRQRRQIRPLRLDLLSDEDCEQAVSQILSEQASLDVLVHCAGAGLAGSVEDTSLAEAVWQMDNLFLGTVRVTRPTVAAMRSQGHGRIILLGSVAATVPIPFQVYYSAAKAAVQAFALGLADEVYPFGIQVCVIAPGDTRTGFTQARQWAARNQAQGGPPTPYQTRLERSVARMAHDEQNGMAPEVIARSIVSQVCRRRPKPLCTPGLGYQLLTGLARILPVSLVRRVVRSMYA